VQKDPPGLEGRIESGLEIEAGIDHLEPPPRLRPLQRRRHVLDVHRSDLGNRPGQRRLDGLVQAHAAGQPGQHLGGLGRQMRDHRVELVVGVDRPHRRQKRARHPRREQLAVAVRGEATAARPRAPAPARWRRARPPPRGCSVPRSCSDPVLGWTSTRLFAAQR
jgi:hypothetical protein